MSVPFNHLLPNDPRDPDIGPEVIARIRAGDVQAFEQLFFAYHGRLLAFATRYLRSREAAEEVVQDVFSLLWARRDSWVIETSVRAYLYTAVRRASSVVVRHNRVVERYASGLTDTDRIGGMGTWDNQADSALTADEVKLAFARAVATLAPRMQRAYVLRAEHRLSYAEIAEVMGVAPKTVENLIARARARLYEALRPYW